MHARRSRTRTLRPGTPRLLTAHAACRADTGTLNYLVLIDAIELLPKLFERVFTPEAVGAELLDQDAPAIGEIIGGSQREERIEVLDQGRARHRLLRALRPFPNPPPLA